MFRCTKKFWKLKMFKPRILLLTNEPFSGAASGQINGYELLVNSNEIESCNSVSFKKEFDKQPAFERVLSAVTKIKYDVVIIWSPSNFPDTYSQFLQLTSKIGTRPILYWEGDPWGSKNKKKPVTEQMSWWMSLAEIVFTVAGEPHISTFKQIGAKNIFFIPHTYCHLKFRNEELELPSKFNDETVSDLIVIANNTAIIPGLSGSPGSLQRWELITRLHFDSNHIIALYGKGWPKGWSKGYLSYGDQAKEIRRSRISLNWDNFCSYDNYASDRLPISLIAGRPHITTRHSGMNWAPNEHLGLFQEQSPKLVILRAKELLEINPEKIWELGVEAHRWAQNRISHRQSARYILSSFFGSIKKPPSDPWANFPGPW